MSMPADSPAGLFPPLGSCVNAMLQCRFHCGCRRLGAVGAMGLALSFAGILRATAADPDAAIAATIGHLGAEEFAAREAASQQLAALGAAAIDPLVAAAAAADPERALRAIDILQ